MSFWNSLEFLHKINGFLIISWVVISAIFGILSWKVQSRISELNITSEKELKTKVDNTESKAAEFEKKLVQSEKLRVETEDKLKTEIQKTNKKIEPRTITLELFKHGVEILSKLQSRNFVVKVMSEDFEGQDFAPKFAEMLSSSGWKLSGIQPHGGWRFDDGIKIIVQSKSDEIEALYDFLSVHNFNPQIELSAKDDFVRIFIGKLPK